MPAQKHFQKIDFLRGIAILCVFQAHFIWYYFPDYTGVVSADGGHPAKKVLLLNFLPRTVGWAGVTIFILVSGFLLHLGYLRDRQWFTLRGFYSRRFWRVYPPYLLVLVLFTIFLEHGRTGSFAFLLHLFSLQNVTTQTYFSVNPTFWCLALEVQFYVLYALVLPGIKRWGIKPVLVVSFLVSIGWQAAGGLGPWGQTLPWANSSIALEVVWVVGAFLAEAFDKGQRLLDALNRNDLWVVLGAFVLAGYIAPQNAVWQYVAGLIGVVAMDAILHAGWITLQGRPGQLIVAIGLCSYSIFLIHQPLLQAWIDFLDLHSPHYPGYRLVDGIIVSLVIIGISWLGYLYVEQTSIRIGTKLRRRPKVIRMHKRGTPAK